MSGFLSTLEGITLSKPATDIEIFQCEQALGVILTQPLLDIFKTSNGVYGEFESGLIWTLERIINDNILFWNSNNFNELYMPFQHMLFIADAGNGDQFFTPLYNKKILRNDVYVWNHEDDSRTWVAPSIQKYIEWWLGGKIKT